MLSRKIEKRLIFVHKIFVYIGDDRRDMCEGKREILFTLNFTQKNMIFLDHQSMTITCVLIPQQVTMTVLKKISLKAFAMSFLHFTAKKA